VRDLAAPLLPEFLGVLGVDVFLVLSILTCLFDFPVFLQYVYHVSAFVGFGQLWIGFLVGFSEETRFLICVGYLVIGLANVVVVNGYIGSRDKRVFWTTAFLSSITVPLILISFSAMSYYVNRVAIALPLLPLIPPEAIAAILLVCGIVLAISLLLPSFIWKPTPAPPPVTKKAREVKRNK
jgi:hypothetical protein